MTTPSQLISSLRANFNKGVTRSLDFRRQQLKGLLAFLNECEDKIFAALKSDLNKCVTEAFATEMMILKGDVELALKKLTAWTKPRRVTTTMVAQPGTSYIHPEPLGVVAIIGPWNYPLLLTLDPAIGALAAGNCVIIKPSEVATATSALLANELPKYISQDCLRIIEGGVDETTALLNEELDHIFYTGNGKVGRIVMTAAAKHLTPVTLELGGKSPCIVDASADIATAARRITWGKFTNAGQTCIAPDYVLVDAKVEKALLEEIKKNLIYFYGTQPQASPDYGRIINEHHYQRLMKLITDSTNSGEIVAGGRGNESERYIAPTVLRNVPHNSPVMEDEIFGPILPVIAVANMTAAIAFINARPKPLSLYIFSDDSEQQKQIVNETSSGSVGINVALLQIAGPYLPFGGVGASGMGAYHGKYSFDTFTHFKSVLKKSTWFDLALFYPPYTKRLLTLLRWL